MVRSRLKGVDLKNLKLVTLFALLCLGFNLSAEQMFPATALGKIESLGFQFELWNGEDNHNAFFYRSAEIQKIGGVQLLYFRRPVLSYLKNIKKVQGKVLLDGAFFAQVAAMILNNRIYEPKQKLFDGAFLMPHLAAELFEIDFAQIKINHPQAFQFLIQAPLRNKSQWLIRVDQDQYLGLGKNGVEVLSAQEWIFKTRMSLNLEILNNALLDDCTLHLLNRPAQRMRETIKKYLQYERAGLLEDWILASYPAPI